MQKKKISSFPQGSLLMLTFLVAVAAVVASSFAVLSPQTDQPTAATTVVEIENIAGTAKIAVETEVETENVVGASTSVSLGFNNAEQVVSTGTESTSNMVWVADGKKVTFVTRSEVGTVTKTLTVAEGVPTLPALAREGNLVVVGWSERSGGTTSVKTVVSLDGGLTFGSAVTLGTGTGLSLAASSSTLTAVWHTDEDNDSSHIVMSTFTGSTWSSPTQIDLSPKAAVWAAVDHLGDTLIVTWRDNRSGEFMVWQRRSLDGGATWENEQQLVMKTSGDPDVCITSDGEVWIAHHGLGKITLLHSLDNGATYTQSLSVGNGFFAHVSCTDTAVMVAWEEATGSPKSGDKKAAYALYTDEGILLTSEAIEDGSVAATTGYLSSDSRSAEVLWIKIGSTALVGTLRHKMFSLY